MPTPLPALLDMTEKGILKSFTKQIQFTKITPQIQFIQNNQLCVSRLQKAIN
jgi:hypothetical protein